MMDELHVEGMQVAVTHPEKLLWPETGIRKIDYLRYVATIAPYLLPALNNRVVMLWCYPNGVHAPGHARKTRPSHAPEWLHGIRHNNRLRMMLNNTPSLIWAANFSALEIHVEADTVDNPGHPTYLAFDLDPSLPDAFDDVLRVAQGVRRVLDALGLYSVAKTSGATGLHIYVPIQPRYSYQEARNVTKFVAEYMAAEMPSLITLDRSPSRRGAKLYFDYLQLWQGKTMSAVYSARATPLATVSTPVSWAEVDRGFRPATFTMQALLQRVGQLGDLFRPVTMPPQTGQPRQELDGILTFLRSHRRF